MSKLIKRIENELNLFWKWAEMDEYSYSKCEIVKEFKEWQYPRWTILIELSLEVIGVISSGIKSKQLYNLLLTLIALDNESETILDECEVKLLDRSLDFLIQTVILHILPQARWQIAEIIGRKNNKLFTKYLLRFVEDSDKYVQRRV